MGKQYPHHAKYVVEYRLRSRLEEVISRAAVPDWRMSYVVAREEERLRGRSGLRTLRWGADERTGGRDRDFGFLPSLNKTLSQRKRYISGRRTWESKYHVSGSSPGCGAVAGRSPTSEV